MLEKKFIKEHLDKTICYQCGESMVGAKLLTLKDEGPLAFIAHAVCPKCQAESMVSLTSAGPGIMPLVSDLSGTEFKKFYKLKSVYYDDVLDLHKLLEKEKIWKLLHKKEKNLKSKTPHLGERD